MISSNKIQAIEQVKTAYKESCDQKDPYKVLYSSVHL